MDLRQKTITGIAWSGIASIVNQIIQFLIMVFLARLLTPGHFGLIGMITIFTGFAAIFGDIGFSAALIQRKEVEDRHYYSVLWLNLIAGMLLMILVMVAAPIVASFYGEPSLTPLTRLIAVSFFLEALSIVQKAILHRAMNFRVLAYIDIIRTSIAGVIAILLAYTGVGAYSLVWRLLLYAGLGTIMMWITAGWHPRLRFDWRSIKELFGFSVSLLGFRSFNYWVRTADNLLIGKFVGRSGLGLYTKAYQIMLLPTMQISYTAGRVMFPALSNIQDDKLRVKRVYLRVINMIALFTFPMMLGLLPLSEHFVLAVFGPNWADMIPIVRIFCIVGFFQSIGATVGWIYQSQGRTDWMFYWGVSTGVLTLGAFAVGIKWGVIGVATAYASLILFLNYFGYAIPGKLIGMRYGEVVRTVSGVFGCAAGMAALVFGVGYILPVNLPHWSYLAVQVPVGVIAYVFLIHIFRLKAYREARDIVCEQFQGKLGKQRI